LKWLRFKFWSRDQLSCPKVSVVLSATPGNAHVVLQVRPTATSLQCFSFFYLCFCNLILYILWPLKVPLDNLGINKFKRSVH
jgi:hypothetical protein